MERGVGAGKVAKNTIRKTKARKKVTTDDFDLSDEEILAQQQQQGAVVKKKAGKKRKEKIMGPRGGVNTTKKGKHVSAAQAGLMNDVHKDTGYYSAGQNKINDMMRRALEDEKYSALGSIVDTDSSEDDSSFAFGARYGIDQTSIMDGFKQNLTREKENLPKSLNLLAKAKNLQRADETGSSLSSLTTSNKAKNLSLGSYESKQAEADIVDDDGVEEQEDDEDSTMFGQSGNSNNATWVECDKCKKWRRLRGSVDAKKLPLKWFCSMNKNDPEHAKCSAPEEEYTENNTPESATDHRIRKHLRLWVRRLQSNEAYEQKLPTMTRGKKKSVTTNSKEPYEWVRCANPSCGKFRATLRFMDASTICENAKNGEWYCVLNTWDEKMASCAAPQENLPVSGCPPWVLQDE